ncbi:helix-turn-helix domain-containing protein [Chryseolinea sp. T2]|uniref:helix-turn-helix domain-containing protein n=1 Tax=Chryseolinea sp. T2 TaxID=3129255 RepID=UPI0030787F2C
MSSAINFPSVVACLMDPQAPQQQVRAQKFERTGSKILPYSRRDYYKIWITMGAGSISYATETVEINQPALIFSNPLVPYAYTSLEPAGGYMCIFTEDYLKVHGRTESLQESPLFRIGAKSVFFLDEKLLASVSGIFDKIISELETEYTYKHDLARNYVNLLIHEGLKLEPALASYRYHSASERIASLFLELLERQFPIDSSHHALRLKKASDYAHSLSVHVNHLNHAVRAVTGKSTTKHIADRIVTEAQALLRHTDLTIAEIAYALGFDYPNYFNNFFKKSTGRTPLSIRKEPSIL